MKKLISGLIAFLLTLIGAIFAEAFNSIKPHFDFKYLVLILAYSTFLISPALKYWYIKVKEIFEME